MDLLKIHVSIPLASGGTQLELVVLAGRVCQSHIDLAAVYVAERVLHGLHKITVQRCQSCSELCIV